MTSLKGRAWASSNEEEATDEVLAFIAYCYVERGNTKGRIDSNLAAINYFHKVFMDREIPVQSFQVTGAKKGVDQRQGGSRQKQRERGVGGVRVPFTAHMIKVGRPASDAPRKMKVLWCGVALSYHLLLRASELWAGEKDGKVTAYGLRKRHLAWFRRQQQLQASRWRDSDRVEVLFDGSKTDGKRVGAVLSRSELSGQREAGGWSILKQLMEIYEEEERREEIGPDTPLMAYKEGREWKVWNRREALQQMRTIAVTAGDTNPEAYQLHSGRVGGATALAAMGVPVHRIMTEGRWKSDSFMVYLRYNWREAERADRALANAGEVRIPGRGTVWGEEGGGGWREKRG
jgi:hypothetical protein